MALTQEAAHHTKVLNMETWPEVHLLFVVTLKFLEILPSINKKVQGKFLKHLFAFAVKLTLMQIFNHQ